MIENVIKANGEVQKFSAEKLNRWGEWASKNDLSWSDIVMRTLDQLYEGCNTKDIHQAMINVCVDKKDEKHLSFAARLLRGSIYKDVYNGAPTSFTESYTNLIDKGFWQDFKLSKEDLIKIEEVFDPQWDKTYEYTSLLQFVDKYAMREFTGSGYKLVETPQLMLMGISLALFQNDSLEHALNFYRIIRERKLNIATPIMAAARSGENEFTSCFLATSGDTLDSIAAAGNLCYTMTANRAGVGMEFDVRSFGDIVGNNKCKHAGKLPHYNKLVSEIKSVTQGCYDDQTEVLTELGWMFFEDVLQDKGVRVAQVAEDGAVSFVTPLEYFKYEVKEDLYNFTQKGSSNKCMDLLVTGNHNMVYRKNTKTDSPDRMERYSDKNHYLSEDFKVARADELKLSRQQYFEVGGFGTGSKGYLTDKERLFIAFQADGVKKVCGNSKDYAYSFRFKKERKISRLKSILEANGIEYTATLQKDGCVQFYCKVGYELPNTLEWVNISSVDSSWAKSFLQELSYWDSGKQDSKVNAFNYSSVVKLNIDVVQSLCAISGVYSNVRLQNNRKGNRQNLYTIGYSFNRSGFTGRGLKVEKVYYEGFVYCVEVPTNKLIVRRKGKTVVCGNSRGGAATVTFNVLDPEIDDLLRLKNPVTPVSKRIELMDYSLAWNNEFIRRVAKNEDWLLVSKKECPELHTAFYEDREAFPSLMQTMIEKYSGKNSVDSLLDPNYKPSKPKKFNGKIVKARDIMKTFITQRQETGRIYCINIDTTNDHSSFKQDIIRQSNLCQEVCLPTKGFDSVLSLYNAANPDNDGMVGLCFLLATDVGKCSYEELDDVNYYACRALDNILSLTKYPFKALEDIGKKYRSIGIGVTNLAYFMAKNGVTYSSEEGRNLVHKLMEKQQFSLIRSSIELAKERGKFEWYDRTKYPEGSLCIDTYSKFIDEHHSQELLLDWDELKRKQLRHGMRFVTVSAHMPCESSSVNL